MSARAILRLVAVFFILTGWFLTRAAHSDPAPRHTWATYHGSLVEVEFSDSQKLGRIATLTIEGDSEESVFMLSHTQKLPDFERQIFSLPPAAPVEIDAVPRELAGWAAPEGKPLALLVLRHEDHVIHDRDRDTSGGQWIGTAVSIVGYVVAAIFLVVLFVSFRKPARIA